jgi:hypothetical protein
MKSTQRLLADFTFVTDEHTSTLIDSPRDQRVLLISTTSRCQRNALPSEHSQVPRILGMRSGSTLLAPFIFICTIFLAPFLFIFIFTIFIYKNKLRRHLEEKMVSVWVSHLASQLHYLGKRNRFQSGTQKIFYSWNKFG